MARSIILRVHGRQHQVAVDSRALLLYSASWTLRDLASVTATAGAGA